MSIIFDNLKKVKKRQPSTSVYPVINVRKKKNTGVLFLIALLLVAVAGITGFFMFHTQEENKKVVRSSVPLSEKNKAKSVNESEKKELPISYSRTTLPSAEVELKEKIQEQSPEKSVAKNKLIAGSSTVKPAKESVKVSLDIEKDFKNYLVKGDEAYLKGDLEKAIWYYEKALRIKEDIPTHMTLLSIYASAGKVHKIEQILKYPDLYPWLDEDIVAITIKNLAESSFKGDIKSLEKVALEYDKEGRVHEALGYFYEKRNKMALALHHYKEAYRKNSENPDFALKFASVLQKTGNKTGAKEIYQKILNMDIDPILQKKIKVILKKMG